jgi:MarR family transcriptional regulator, 2-MHQ and catechol-resistance regulon repressor
MENKTEMTKNQQKVLKTYTKMMRAAGAVTSKMHRHLIQRRLTSSQFGVLEALYHLGPLSQRDIGKKILKTSGNITLVVDNLEKRRLVKRGKDRQDRRVIMVKLTEKGHRLIHELFPTHAKVAEKTFSILNQKEITELGRLLKLLGTAAEM